MWTSWILPFSIFSPVGGVHYRVSTEKKMPEKSYWSDKLLWVQDESFSEEVRMVVSISCSMVQPFLIMLNMTPQPTAIGSLQGWERLKHIIFFPQGFSDWSLTYSEAVNMLWRAEKRLGKESPNKRFQKGNSKSFSYLQTLISQPEQVTNFQQISMPVWSRHF